MDAGQAPTIRTERLVLRPHRLNDLDAYAALWADPTVTRYTSGRPLAREESWIRILRYAGMWQLLGFGFWAIDDAATGALVGEAGFHELKRAISPDFAGRPEAGWMIHPALHGRGYGGEVVAAIHAWADARLAASETVCIIHPHNTASQALARRIGYGDEIRTRYHNEPSLLFRRQRISR